MATGQANAEIMEDKSPTIVAGHEHPILHDENEQSFIVRRLTPTECARLQGFPDCWGQPNEKTELTDDEAAFWENVRKTHAKANGKKYKPISRDSLLKWYNGLHTDSSEYKMWGNGIALPCAEFVLEGIAAELKSSWLDELLGGRSAWCI